MSTRILLTGVMLSVPCRVLSEDASDGGGLISEMDGGGMSLPDGGMGMDGGALLSPACSCETAMNHGGKVHLCTGSNDEDTCKQFTCNEAGKVRADTCPTVGVRLCCDMEARRLYSHLYEDCTHPGCDVGFRKQCEAFGGSIRVGPCEVPEFPDPYTETEDEGGCSIGSFAPAHAPRAVVFLVSGVVFLLRSRRRRLHRER